MNPNRGYSRFHPRVARVSREFAAMIESFDPGLRWYQEVVKNRGSRPPERARRQPALRVAPFEGFSIRVTANGRELRVHDHHVGKDIGVRKIEWEASDVMTEPLLSEQDDLGTEVTQ